MVRLVFARGEEEPPPTLRMGEVKVRGEGEEEEEEEEEEEGWTEMEERERAPLRM